MAKAYDTVWSDGLLIKLKQKGINGKMLRWIAAYLSPRSAGVKIAGHTSPQLTWDMGVPQGGVLSPLLFAVFVDDLPLSSSPRVQSALYADDSALYTAVSRRDLAMEDAIRDLQDSLDLITTWAKKWRLTFAPGKSRIILLSPDKLIAAPLPPVFLCGAQIPEVREGTVRYLGVLFDR